MNKKQWYRLVEKTGLFNNYSQISLPSEFSNPINVQVNKEQSKEKTVKTEFEDKQKSVVTQDDVDEAIQSLKKINTYFETHLNFSKDESTGITVVKIINTETEEIIRQIPSEEILKLASKMQDVIGVLFDKEY